MYIYSVFNIHTELQQPLRTPRFCCLYLFFEDVLANRGAVYSFKCDFHIWLILGVEKAPHKSWNECENINSYFETQAYTVCHILWCIWPYLTMYFVAWLKENCPICHNDVSVAMSYDFICLKPPSLPPCTHIFDAFILSKILSVQPLKHFFHKIWSEPSHG